ncbi:hypothetical protein HanHA300_Chr01g0022051 [Helianthus annuus]|nr:hypothetical protein HanHA300_Chr01g0022051 [Helianthus annuus]
MNALGVLDRIAKWVKRSILYFEWLARLSKGIIVWSKWVELTQNTVHLNNNLL